MVKRVSLVRRSASLSLEEFQARWLGEHAEIVKRLPDVRGLRFGLVLEWTPVDERWDGVGEVWFDSIASAQAAFSCEPMASELAANRRELFAEAQSCFVIEHTAIFPPP